MRRNALKKHCEITPSSLKPKLDEANARIPDSYLSKSVQYLLGSEMRILGLVASYRKMGNSEVLAREALLAARELGAEVALIRLTDLHVEPCKGCMACLFKGEPCRIEDDVDWFMNQLLESDGVVLSSPTYILSPPGIVKMLIDRMIPLQDSDKIRELAERRRVGVAIGVATNPREWAPFTLPMLKMFLQVAQIRVIGSMLVEAAGPGEVVLDEKAMNRARELGVALVDAIEGREVSEEQGIYACPACRCDLLRWLGNGTVECPLCGIKGKITMKNGKIAIEFPEEQINTCRWKPEMAIKHTQEEILPTATEYIKKLKLIKQKLSRYQEASIETLRPEAR